MSIQSNINDKTDKEKFLEKIDINNNDALIEPSDSSTNFFEKLEKEKYGMILAAISVFFGACGTIYTKIIQKSYPDEFKTVQFLFLRSFTIFFSLFFILI